MTDNKDERRRHRRAVTALLIALLGIALSSCGGGGSGGAQGGGSSNGGGGGSNLPPPPPPPPPPPAQTGAYKWNVTLATAPEAGCLQPGAMLPLSVEAFTQSGAPIADPSYRVDSDVSGAVESDGAGGWLVRGEGAARLTVTYTGEIDDAGTVAPVVFDVLRDGSGPQITIAEPARAAMATATDDVRILGEAIDAVSAVSSLTVNGIQQVGAAALTQTIDARPPGRWGLNVIEVVAADRCGNTSTLSQSYLRSPQYRPAAVAANANARVPRGQTVKLTQTAIDDGVRSDIDDFATLTERVLQRTLSNELASATRGQVVTRVEPGCPGVGYTVSIAAPGATTSLPQVEEFRLQAGGMRQRLSFDRVTVPLRIVQETVFPFTCSSTTIELAATLSALDVSSTSSVATSAVNGRIEATLPSLAVTIGDVALSLTGIQVVDSFLGSLLGLLTGYAEGVVEDVIRELAPPLIEEVLNAQINASATVSMGPFDFTLGAAAGLTGVDMATAGATETAYTQIYPGTAAASPAIGAIARPTAAANLTPQPGPVSYALDDNLTNQGLWALWYGGALEMPDVIGLAGISLAVSAQLPPVLMPGAKPGDVALGIGDLDVTLTLAHGAPQVPGSIEVDAYVTSVVEGAIQYDGVTRELRLSASPEASRSHVHVRRIEVNGNVLADPVQRARVEEYARRLIDGAIEQLVHETLVAAMLPPLRFRFPASLGGGAVDELELTITALTRTADHFVLDMTLEAGGPPAPAELDGYLTLNEPWTQDDIVAMNMPEDFRGMLGHREDPNGNYVASRTVTVRDYHTAKRPACDTAGNSTAEESDGWAICEPQWKFPLQYGYYCGKGRPVREDNDPNTASMDAPRLDAVDYCCRLHDQGLFQREGASLIEGQTHDACGFVMCVSQGAGFPADIQNRLPDVERARRQMYNKAALLCGMNVQPPLPAPRIVP